MLHARFLRTRPVPVVPVDFVAVFLVVVVVPLRTELAVVFLVAVPRAAAPFLTTVPELASLDSLLARDLRAVRVAGLEAGAREAVVAALGLVRVAAVVLLELVLAVEAVVTLRPTPALVAFALSTMVESIPAAVAGRGGPEYFSGEAGRAMPDLMGEAGRDRFASLELDEVGERICAGRTWAISAVGAPRILFIALSLRSISFSLSPEMASLGRTCQFVVVVSIT